MTTIALNNLWTYLQGLALSQSDREWLASKLVVPTEKAATAKAKEATAEERKAQFLRMAGIWSESEEGEEYYQMMKHRNDGLTVVTHNIKHFGKMPGVTCVDWVDAK